MNAIKIYRIGNWFYKKKIMFMSVLFQNINFLLFNSYIPSSSEIGKKSKFAYGAIGCVIHSNAHIGDNCTIGANVTIGGKSKCKVVPIIGNNVYISTGAKVLGPVIVGNEVIIGANAVVVKNIPSGSIVVGIPARIIKSNIKIKDYI